MVLSDVISSQISSFGLKSVCSLLFFTPTDGIFDVILRKASHWNWQEIVALLVEGKPKSWCWKRMRLTRMPVPSVMYQPYLVSLSFIPAPLSKERNTEGSQGNSKVSITWGRRVSPFLLVLWFPWSLCNTSGSKFHSCHVLKKTACQSWFTGVSLRKK